MVERFPDLYKLLSRGRGWGLLGCYNRRLFHFHSPRMVHSQEVGNYWRIICLITEYATNSDYWEGWQREYQFGIILIFPPEPLLSQINALRATYDPQSQATCDAHISLTIPLPRPINEDHWKELMSLTADVSPFSIQYGPLRHYLPHPGVCLNIEPQETLSNLLSLIESASVFVGAPARRYPFSAHMTIAEFISAERTVELMEELQVSAPLGSFLCAGVSYVVPNEYFHFAERRYLAFGSTPQTRTGHRG